MKPPFQCAFWAAPTVGAIRLLLSFANIQAPKRFHWPPYVRLKSSPTLRNGSPWVADPVPAQVGVPATEGPPPNEAGQSVGAFPAATNAPIRWPATIP